MTCLRAGDPPGGRPRQGAGRARPRPLRQDRTSIATCWSPAAAPRVSLAALAAGRAGARVVLADEQTEPSAARCCVDAARIDGEPAADWVARTVARAAAHARSAPAAAHHRLRLPRPQLPRSRSSAAPIICRPAGARSAPAPVAACAPSRSCWRPARIERPLVFADNDRPGVMLAGAVRDLRQPLRRRCRARAPSSSPTTTAPIAAALDLATPASPSPRSSIARRSAGGAAGAQARAAPASRPAGSCVTGAYGGQRVDAASTS